MRSQTIDFLNMNNLVESLKQLASHISFEKIVGALMLIVLLIIISKSLARIIGKMLGKTKLGKSFAGFITTILRYVMYFISILIVFDYIGLPVTSLVALFSLFGLAVSLSVQSLLSNLMSGLSLHTLKPFEVGDYIETDIAGTVKGVGLFYTELVTADNKRVYIPNEKIMAGKLINYNGEGKRRIDLVFNAKYTYDPETVKSVLYDAVMSVETVENTPEPIIAIDSYGDSSINYSVWVWTESGKYFETKFALMDAVWEKYKENGISMAYNHLEVEIINK